MAKNRYPHLFLRGREQALRYTASRRIVKKRIPERDRAAHAARLQRQLEDTWVEARRLASDRSAVSLPTKDGIYLEFQGSGGYDLIAKGLEDLKSKRIRLCNVRVVSTPDSQKKTVATVYIPEDKKGYFLKKIDEYATEQTRKGNPRHSDLIRSIEGIRLAVL